MSKVHWDFEIVRVDVAAAEEEKVAREWLDRMEDLDRADCPPNCATVIKRLLAQPRLPAVPTLKMLHIYSLGGVVEPEETHRALYAELTKPKTKTVEMWHVEFYNIGNDLAAVAAHRTKEAADTCADSYRRLPDDFACVRVTGPHQQEVPADE